MTPPLYLVINLQTEERGLFQTARDAGVFMWGRDASMYALYVCYAFPWTGKGDLVKELREWA